MDRTVKTDKTIDQSALPTTNTQLFSNSYVIRHSRDDYAAICDYLKQLGFQDISCVHTTRSIKSNWLYAGSILFDTIALLPHIRRIRRADTLFAVSYAAIPIQLFMKFGLIRCRRLFWFGFFLHSHKAFRVFRALSRFLSSDQERYIIFSEYEKSLYSREIGIPLSKLITLPWGSWNKNEEQEPVHTVPSGDYFFAGGATNRDYLSLVKVFENREDKLVIVCSSTMNKDILSVRLPPNIEVHTDLPAEQFDKLVQGAKACILTLKHDTGASGQSVLLRYMRHAKAVIASNIVVMREYIENGVSGILVDDPPTELSGAIDTINGTPDLVYALGRAAHQRFITTFSYEAISSALKDIISEKHLS